MGKAGAKVMSLQDPTKKMSKSDENPNASVMLLDDKDTIIRKFKRAVTDSDTEVRFDEEAKPGVSNLMTIYSCVTGKSYDDITAEFAGKGYGGFKMAVGEAVADELAPLQARYDRLLADKSYIDGRIKENDEKAYYFSNKTLRKVHKKVGLTELIR
jgi:tryptophanyl-tRNA synthetase